MFEEGGGGETVRGLGALFSGSGYRRELCDIDQLGQVRLKSDFGKQLEVSIPETLGSATCETPGSLVVWFHVD
ncbi:hypothetical protein AVEN_268894-1, partial [Araneus ventricosus]